MNNKLQTRLINYFLLIAFAAMLIGVEFYFEMNRTGLQTEMCAVPAHATDDAVSQPLINLRNKVVIMFGVLTLVVAIVLMMFIKNITHPLQKMADVAAKINEGDLSQVVPIETGDEIGQVGTAINELTSNLQEVAKFTATTTMEAIDRLNQLIEAKPDNTEALSDMKDHLKTLCHFVDSFTLLHTDIDDD
ncbi:MAG: HAMP domain-containing protein [Gammaproteobacteria bacterium]|nr:HAMP domain-containing protein [Gammaproteobacteria bacterium]MDH5800718.1 HAMP domain-containing protein [Gammaproteobacteria bacterium]